MYKIYVIKLYFSLWDLICLRVNFKQPKFSTLIETVALTFHSCFNYFS